MKMTGHPLMLRLGSSLNLLSVIMVLVCYSTTCILAMRSGSNSNTDEPNKIKFDWFSNCSQSQVSLSVFKDEDFEFAIIANFSLQPSESLDEPKEVEDIEFEWNDTKGVFLFQWSSQPSSECCWGIDDVKISHGDKDKGAVTCYGSEEYEYDGNSNLLCSDGNNKTIHITSLPYKLFGRNKIEIEKDEMNMKIKCVNLMTKISFKRSHPSISPLTPSSTASLPSQSQLISLFPSSSLVQSSSSSLTALASSSSSLTPSASSSSSLTPSASSSTSLTPSASSSSSLTPSASSSTSLTPSASSSSSLTPSASSSSSLTPLASKSSSLTPLASSSTLLTPSASSSSLLTPLSSSSSLTPLASRSSSLTPLASSSTSLTPSASSSSLLAPLSSSSLSSPLPSSSTSLTPLSSNSSLPTTTPSPISPSSVPSARVDIMCVSDGVWPLTSAGTNVTLSTGVRECLNGTVEAVRFCHSNGVWSSVQCVIISSPTSSLMTQLSSSSSTSLSSSSLAQSSSNSPSLTSTTPSPISPSSVSSVDIKCVSDSVWPLTSAGTNATLSTGVRECYNGTVEAVRLCDVNGVWRSVNCMISPLLEATIQQIVTAPVDGLEVLSLSAGNNISYPQTVLLLNTALNTVLERSPNETDIQEFVESFLNVSSRVIASSIDGTDDDKDDRRRVGSQLLRSLDSLALTVIEPSDKLININGSSLKVQEINTALQQQRLSTVGIKVGKNSITLPNNVFVNALMPVRVASFFFPNLSRLLPPLDTDSSIISSIISSTIDCQSCPITDLTENVTIQLSLKESVPPNKQVSCVFYNFESQDGLLPSGDWNTSGCTTAVNGDLVTCSCNHLTHFAILLSPGGPEISAIHHDVLNTIGLVLVPISLLCMVLVILTYTLIRSLWSIRNYIHIMLCASLFMAQLVFIIGVDKIENQGACSAVAVILLYLFLVSFMWMLMEGVVLYVTLVRVFITNYMRYIVAFTVASYAVPAVYLAIVTPIGYLVDVNNTSADDHTHFLYYTANDTLTACWLNYSTGFIWSFIAPVIVIIMINIGFFIMAIRVMKKHTKKQQKTRSAQLKLWLSSTVTLTIVMGIAWLGGLLAFRRELLPVSYIITIFIAAQGIIIFILLVPLSKQVREAYHKLWLSLTSRSDFLSKMSDRITNLSILSGNSKSLSKSWNSNGGARKHVGGIVLGTFDDPPTNSTTLGLQTLKKNDLMRESVLEESCCPSLPADYEAPQQTLAYSHENLSGCIHGNGIVIDNSLLYEAGETGANVNHENDYESIGNQDIMNNEDSVYSTIN